MNDVNHILDEHIKIFEDALQNRNVQDEDVALDFSLIHWERNHFTSISTYLQIQYNLGNS